MKYAIPTFSKHPITISNAAIMSGFFIAVHAPGTSEGTLQGFLRSDLQQTPSPLLVHSEMDSYAE
jgi:hypothetical protein